MPPFPESVLPRIEALPEVGGSLASVEDTARLLDRKGDLIASSENSVGLGIDTGGDEALSPLRLVDGRWPQGASEIAIDRATASDQDFAVGQTIRAVANGPARTYRIAGLVQFGSGESLGGITIAVFDLPTAQRLFDHVGKLDEIQVAAAGGTSTAALMAAIRPLLPPLAEVKTAAAQAEDASEDVRSGLSYIRYFLLAFGGIALFVGSFVIANTLSITIAQRVRELATLRTLGASRRQVLWSVVLEALIIGILASLVGLFAGLGIAKLLDALMSAIGIDLPEGGSCSARGRWSSAWRSAPSSRCSPACGRRYAQPGCRPSSPSARARSCPGRAWLASGFRSPPRSS